MGDIKDLSHKDAIKKMKELAEDIRICMFCTKTEKIPFDTRPMGTQQVDEEGNFWFFSASDSDKNSEIKQDEDVQLLYSKPSDSHFLSIAGKATISKDKKKIDELWNKLAEAWFKDGKDDPRLTVICVRPSEAHYWDTKNGKMISLLKIAISAISGKQMDGGIEGELKI
ncbi:MAG: pyridoxamine 5'-phosphate oxidase family protein [Bacteroidetes bacterium]|nr:pyridoxamine 5'-phosphate oxidase family protein [Bacteroidota bacterium]